MATLPVVVNSVADGYLDAYLGSGNFSFLINVTNADRNKIFSDLKFGYRIEGQNNHSSDFRPDYRDYFDVLLVSPDRLDLAPGEEKSVAFVISPEKASMQDADGSGSESYSFNIYTWVEDAAGNRSVTGRNPYVNLAIFPDQSEVNLGITSQLLAKWQKEAGRPEMLYSHRLMLSASDYAVSHWVIAFSVPEGVYASQEWIETVSNWMEVRFVASANTLFLVSKPGHIINPGVGLIIDLQLVCPEKNPAFETLNDLTLQANSAVLR